MGVIEEIGPGALLGGRFDVRGRLGSGGSAAVFLATDTVLEREVAIKRLHTSGSDADVQRFRREARLGASLMHPNLVTIFDTIAGDEGLFIVMEYVHGRPLSDVIGPDGLEPRRALEILGPVASALDYAHEHGVVHRDVKPANVLISEAGIVKLVDLGTATADHITRITTENQVLGTLAYIAPERLAGDSVGEAAADVYSLAVVAFEAIAGRTPYRPDTPAALLDRIRNSAPPDLGVGPPQLTAALARGMDPDPDRRQASATALVRDLEGALREAGSPARRQATEAIRPVQDERSEDAPPARPFVPPPVAAGEHRSWLLPAIGLVAVLVAVGVWLAVSGGGGNSSGGGTQGGPAKASASASGKGGGSSTAVMAAAPASASPATGTELNDQGYELIQEGNYDDAVRVLRRAVTAFPKGTSDINYAYALYNLGHALRMAGRPEEAIPVLKQRLQIPDQTETVQAELDAARAAAGR